jgi:hypothetical protein
MTAEAVLEQPIVVPPPMKGPRHVADCVLAQLGRPSLLFRVDAKPVGKDRYRVNVYCAQEGDHPVKRVQMTDSFFVTVTEAGIESEPAITRKYL